MTCSGVKPFLAIYYDLLPKNLMCSMLNEATVLIEQQKREYNQVHSPIAKNKHPLVVDVI